MYRPLFFRSEVTKYVLFLVGRVGSTYLTSLLNSHPQILACEEELRDLESSGAKVQYEWAENFLTPPLLGRHRARGFNVKLVHVVDRQELTKLLHEKQSKIIHMQRRNRIKAVVSRLNGRRLVKSTGMWGLFDESKRPTSFTANPDEFDELLKHRERVDAELANYIEELQLPKLSLYYEDLLGDESAFLETVFNFLEVEPKPIQGSTLKITSDNLQDVLINFEEIKAQYIGTMYEPMFDEVVVNTKFQ